MSIKLDNRVAKNKMFDWIKRTLEQFVIDYITIEQRAMLVKHVDRMQAHQGAFEVKCEIAQSADGQSMRIVTTISPARPS